MGRPGYKKFKNYRSYTVEETRADQGNRKINMRCKDT